MARCAGLTHNHGARMRAQIAITRNGITQASTETTPPDGGVLARRANRDFQIMLHRRVSETALINLMRALRAVDAGMVMTLVTAGSSTRGLSRRELCLQLTLRALGIIEAEHESLFMSNLELFNAARPQPAIRSKNLLRLAKLPLAGKDAPTALMQASAAGIRNLVSVGQNRSMRLYYLAVPEPVDWPSTLPTAGAPLDEATSSRSCRWLMAIYEGALAIQAPLFQHGFIRHEGHMRPFQRIIHPIAPQLEKPNNYRVLTSAETLDDPELIIV